MAQQGHLWPFSAILGPFGGLNSEKIHKIRTATCSTITCKTKKNNKIVQEVKLRKWLNSKVAGLISTLCHKRRADYTSLNLHSWDFTCGAYPKPLHYKKPSFINFIAFGPSSGNVFMQINLFVASLKKKKRRYALQVRWMFCSCSAKNHKGFYFRLCMGYFSIIHECLEISG